MSCIHEITERELIQEIQRRIDRRLVNWGFSYDYSTDFTSMALISNQCGYRLNFRQKTGIENSFMCRQVYKSCEPILKRAEERKKAIEYKAQNEAINRVYEALKNAMEYPNQKKKKKQ